MARTLASGARLPDAHQELDPVHSRHEDVRNDEIGRLPLEMPEGHFPVRCVGDGMPCAFQDLPEDLQDAWLVINDQDVGHLYTPLLQ